MKKYFNAIDFTTLKPSQKQVMNTAKDITINNLEEILSNAFGEENVSRVKDNEISLCIGFDTDENGNKNEVCVNINVKPQPSRDETTEKYVTEPYDRKLAALAYKTNKKFKSLSKSERKKYARPINKNLEWLGNFVHFDEEGNIIK